jgi:membrane protein
MMKAAFTFVMRVMRNVESKHLSLVAAGLAYYFLMSLFPALMVLSAVGTYLPLHGGMEDVSTFLGYMMPPQAVSLFNQFVDSIRQHRTGLLSYGLLITLWLSSKGVKAIIAGLDMVYGVQAPRRMWTNRVLAFGLTFGVGILLLLGITLTLAGPVLETLLSRAVPVQSLWIRVWPYLQWLPAAIFMFAAIELVYVMAPNVPAQRRVTIPGALVAAASWLALSWGLGFYFQHFGTAKLARFYAFLATPIAVTIWLYWSAFALVLGAEINSSLQSHTDTGAHAAGRTRPPRKRDVA